MSDNIGGDCEHGYPAGHNCPECEAPTQPKTLGQISLRTALEDMMREYESKWSDEPPALIQARKALANINSVALPAAGEKWTTKGYYCGFVHLFAGDGTCLSEDFHDFDSANKVRDAHNATLPAAQPTPDLEQIAREADDELNRMLIRPYSQQDDSYAIILRTCQAAADAALKQAKEVE